jgi:L-rhamnose mutarotase
VTRHVLTVNLRNDPAVIQTYRDHHRRAWPEVLESLRRVGVEEMDIYLLGRQLVMVLEVRDGIDFRRAFAAHSASSARVAEWERLMKSVQEPMPDAAAGDWWALMEPVFHLHGDQPTATGTAERSRVS